ncbi:hypothetical protein BO78DRAFT_384414 [Aspergillus sclerotiicarbonarius CBS 121057]|uniref:Uncharacterized protein n=1 Tax=Aspergillus sclerotiicarbonarius (strain CBS 121057 / IBT 28362) TaxID=1448318 RepID=A0A319FLB3_ASPSB|nr:hypothetical protein BO78DRAFT_384414 [Aspergillus sclerotiicarbonarius CBS 121057]
MWYFFSCFFLSLRGLFWVMMVRGWDGMGWDVNGCGCGVYNSSVVGRITPPQMREKRREGGGNAKPDKSGPFDDNSTGLTIATGYEEDRPGRYCSAVRGIHSSITEDEFKESTMCSIQICSFQHGGRCERQAEEKVSEFKTAQNVLDPEIWVHPIQLHPAAKIEKNILRRGEKCP